MVRPASCPWNMHCSIHPNWNRHGYHKSAQQHLPNLPTSLRRCLPRSTCSQHGLRNIWLYLLRTRHKILRRPKTRSLHENPSPSPLLGTNGSHSRCLSNPNRRPELDVPQRPRHLHTRCNQWLHLSSRARPLQRQHPLGRRRTRRILRPKRHVPHPRMVFPLRCHRAHRPLALRSQTEKEYSPQDQPPRSLRQPKLDPARHWAQLLRLGTGVLYLQLLDSAPSYGLVGEIHDDFERRARLGTGVWTGGCFLWICVPRLDEWIYVVGNRGLQTRV